MPAKVGYPDMEGALMWVMAARPDGESGFSDPAMRTLSATIATPLVALLNPAAAETILGQIEAAQRPEPRRSRQYCRRELVNSLALVDLKHAEGLVEAELIALEAPKAADFHQSGLFRMIEALLTPPSQREEYFREKIGAGLAAGHRQLSEANFPVLLPTLCPG